MGGAPIVSDVSLTIMVPLATSPDARCGFTLPQGCAPAKGLCSPLFPHPRISRHSTGARSETNSFVSLSQFGIFLIRYVQGRYTQDDCPALRARSGRTASVKI